MTREVWVCETHDGDALAALVSAEDAEVWRGAGWHIAGRIARYVPEPQRVERPTVPGWYWCISRGGTTIFYVEPAALKVCSHGDDVAWFGPVEAPKAK